MRDWREAVVTEEKILDYLLSVDHPTGGDKAAFSLGVGYTRTQWTRLRDDLRRLASAGTVVAEKRTDFGIKHVVDGMIETPDGRTVALRTIWISDEADGAPRLVTAYPGKGVSGNVQRA